MANKSEHKIWCSSKDTKKVLKISDCELMHMRLAGNLEFKKSGNAYYYLIDNNAAKGIQVTYKDDR
ncbi:hypothetical protein [Alkalimarinus alittae]|uniref:Uncharacterized protein n=1 Tax=Alkalimarinus alittae TaxID=2961619 RepID=A0ABY6N3Z1_9ALTE|nr:hypothetical protein [Alkalimarinus alittae]UZE96811.1 hypothetical protein NKI27_03400 [Alkalimarinus alittae]